MRGEDEELELRDYLRVMRRRAWTIVGVLTLVVAVALGASFLQTPVYRSQAELLLQPRSTESIFDPSVVQTFAGGKSAQTEIRVLKSEPVRELVRDAIGSSPPVSASNPTDTDFLIVSAEATDPEVAARVANAYSDAYAEYRRRQAVSDLEKAAVDLREQIDELDRQIADSSTVGTTALTQQRDLFSTRLGQIRLAIRQKTGGVQVVTPALASSEPVRPTPARNGVVAAVVGLILGVGLAFLRDYLDDSIRSKDDLERALPSLPVLGLIPALSAWKDTDAPFVVTVEEPKSPAAEAYRSLRTSVQFMGVERELQVIQVTSPSAGEGKSTTIANLAVALARAGQRVVVVCCDLRRPRIHEFFGVGNDIGLTSALLGELAPAQAVQPVPGLANVSLLASGPVPPNPSELLAGGRIAAILDALRADADVVLVDCPPILPVTDAAVLANRVDGTLLVVSAGHTDQKELQRAVELLRQVEAPLLGCVLNGVPESAGYGYAYRYRSSYESSRPAAPPAPAVPSEERLRA